MNVFILGVLISIILWGFIAERNKTLSYAIMMIFFVLICFSYDEYDYKVYTAVYETIGYSGESPYEPLFNLLMKFGNMMGLNYFQYRMVITVISLLLINSTIQKFTDRPALVWAMFIVFPGWILTTLLRHMMAFSVMVFGLRYVFDTKKRSTLKLLVCIVIASLIHNSFWAFLILLLAKCVRPRYLLIISVAVVAIVYFSGSNNLLFKLFELLPTNDGYLDKYMSDSYSNINGIIYNVFRQSVVMLSGYVAVHMYRLRVKQGAQVEERQAAFMDKVLDINNASILILGIVYYTMVASRMYHLIMIVNTLAWGICLNLYRRNGSNRVLLKTGAMAMCFLLSFLACTVESSVLFEYVLQMHFETNDLINLFN